MKKSILLLVNAFILFIAKGQNPVPNSSFEQWDSQTRPTTWYSCTNITQSTQSHSGTYAAKGATWVDGVTPSSPDLSAGDQSGNGIPVSQNYKYLNFYYIFSPDSGDKIQVEVYADDASATTFGGGISYVSNASAQYTVASIPIGYNFTDVATDFTIDFFITNSSGGNPHLGSFYIIDDVSLTMASVTAINEPGQNALNLSVFPNPANNWIEIKGNNINESCPVKIYDVSGRLLCSQQVSANGQVDVHDLAQGFYLVAVNQDNEVITKKIQIVR